jgi:hypothetical protein
MLSHLFASWASLYGNHAALRTAIGFAHVGGLVVGGGSAITADLATITADREGPDARSSQLHLLNRIHRLVVGGLLALFASGALLFAADVETFLGSRLFWLKMGLVALLLMNGTLLLRGERQVQRGEPRAWTRLHHTAMASLALWFLTTLIGAALPNIG